MEIAYIPCLAYPAGEMKHGPIALIEEGSPVVVIAPNDGVQDRTLNAIHECKARGARIILIHEEGDSISEIGDVNIAVPKTHPMKKPVKNVDLWKRLKELTKSNQVEWNWVKGHSNDPMNDLADELAKKATPV